MRAGEKDVKLSTGICCCCCCCCFFDSVSNTLGFVLATSREVEHMAEQGLKCIKCNETRETEWHSFFGCILDTDQQKYTSDTSIIRDATGTSMAAVRAIIKSNLADAVTLCIACSISSRHDQGLVTPFRSQCTFTRNLVRLQPDISFRDHKFLSS